MKQFWMIYGIGQRQPAMQHESRELASMEARRLARTNPDVTFVVLEAVEAVTKREFSTVTFRAAQPYSAPARGRMAGIDDDIPF